MTVVRGAEGAIHLVGDCGADDAEPLLEHLFTHPDATIDWSGCERAHTAVVQLLLVAGRPVRGPPKDEFLKRWVEPLLATR